MTSTPISVKSATQESVKPAAGKSHCEKKFKSIYGEASSKKKNAQEKEEESPLLTPFELIQQKLPAAFSSSQEISLPASLKVEALFEEMITTMTHLNDNGIQETTFYLDSESPLFSGMQITITEFSTAPKIFNIELLGSPEASLILQANLTGLIDTFNKEERKFKINRLETHYLSNKKRSLVRQQRSEGKDDSASTLSLD